MPAYNASGTIVDCLQAILSSTAKPSEVIVYHDGLTDNVNRMALTPHVRVITNPGAAVGPARGRNIGARESTCEILIFVDADVIVAKDAFRLLLDEMASDSANLGGLWILRPGPAGDEADRALRKLATPLGPSERPTRGCHILVRPRGGAPGRLLDRRWF